jgi:hypothetical protein
MNAPKPQAKKEKTTTKSSPSFAPIAITHTVGGDGQTTQGAAYHPEKKKETQMLHQRASMKAMEYLVTKKKK